MDQHLWSQGCATQPRPQHSPLQGCHSLGLVPGDRLHFGVGQQVRAVTNLRIHHALLGLHLHELISDPFDGIPAAPGEGKKGLGTTSSKALGSSGSKPSSTLHISDPLLNGRERKKWIQIDKFDGTRLKEPRTHSGTTCCVTLGESVTLSDTHLEE